MFLVRVRRSRRDEEELRPLLAREAEGVAVQTVRLLRRVAPAAETDDVTT
jgi:hypothetical protein